MPVLKLTRDRVEGAKPSGTRYEVRDAACPGLHLVVQPSGAKSWAFRYVIAGATRKLTLGQYPALTLDMARADAAMARGEVAKGGDPAGLKAETRKTAPANTVLAAFKAYDLGHLSWGREYIDHETGERSRAKAVEPAIGEETAAATRSFFLRRVLPLWGRRPVGSITRQDVVVLLDDLKGYKDARRKGKTRLSHFFGWTMDRNATVTVNPAAGVQTGEIAPSRERALTDAELRAVWLACGSLANFGAMVKTMILTLARRSEVSDMPICELSKSMWSLDGTRTKNGRPNEIARTPLLNDVLASVKRGDDTAFVFEGRHHNRPIGGFSDLKQKLDALTGDAVAPWTLHDLRRTGTSVMQRLGIPFEVREACCNHTIKGVAGVYNRHDYSNEKRQAFEALAAEVARIVNGEQDSKVVPLRR
ncbi:integrase arm-type DNA-binding domain-containing protein [Bradyrhizobium sp. WSM1417]|uniref:tyrosine-type recombinase/integrase n=1 Tax=Bradyrhizobium sp. WSM1417 TaxID=754500 RepID=UPI000481D1A5|nr:integrase arm-type DNA-binding domain-containing protein [Bradyrhizobium sp. WSM1417]